MDRRQMETWAQVWHATQRPGSVLDFLDWVAENGYVISKGDVEPVGDRDDAFVILTGADEAESARVPWDDPVWVASRDETPTVCATVGCGRTRPRWTMEVIGGKPVCAATFRMHCAVCCKPGEYLTHYTEDEHRHALCVVAGCGTEVPEREAYCDEHKRELAEHPEHFA
jgi:hypothetical protein